MRRKYYVALILIALTAISIFLFFSDKTSVEYTSAPNPLVAIIRKNEAEKILLTFVGDIMLSRSIGALMESKGDWSYPFRLIKPHLEQADFLFGNLEGPISDRGVLSGSIYSFRANPRAIEGLRYAGFDAVSLANNHMWDYGATALLDTLPLLSESGIGFAGAGKDYESAHTPFIARVGDATLALLAYTDLLPTSLGKEDSKPAISLFNKETVVREIAEAKTHADIIIVSLHWGNEYETESTQAQKQTARELIDAGADLVIGHHPHVIQEIEKYKNGYIAYSLGNFVFDQNFSEDTGQGLILNVEVSGKTISSVTTKTVRFNNTFQPILDE